MRRLDEPGVTRSPPDHDLLLWCSHRCPWISGLIRSLIPGSGLCCRGDVPARSVWRRLALQPNWSEDIAGALPCRQDFWLVGETDMDQPVHDLHHLDQFLGDRD